MLKLIKLEYQKNRIGKYVRSAVILASVLCLFLFALAFFGIANDPDTGVPDAALGKGTISAPIELFTSMSFLVFTGIMLSSFIVSVYKNKTMSLMFSYPIKRQKILAVRLDLQFCSACADKASGLQSDSGRLKVYDVRLSD